MTDQEQNVHEALKSVARALLLTWDAIDKYNTLEEALEYSIYLGGGSSFWPERQDYWSYEYNTDFTIVLNKRGSDEEVTISRKRFMGVARGVWNDLKHNSKQLQLF